MTINIAGSATVAQHRSTTEAFIGAGTELDVGRRRHRSRPGASSTSSRSPAPSSSRAPPPSAPPSRCRSSTTRCGPPSATAPASRRAATSASTMASVVKIISVAAALAILAEELTLPITVNILLLTTSGGASIGAGATVDAGKHLLLDAGADASIVAVAGTGAFLGSNVGIGLAVGVTDADPQRRGDDRRRRDDHPGHHAAAGRPAAAPRRRRRHRRAGQRHASSTTSWWSPHPGPPASSPSPWRCRRPSSSSPTSSAPRSRTPRSPAPRSPSPAVRHRTSTPWRSPVRSPSTPVRAAAAPVAAAHQAPGQRHATRRSPWPARPPDPSTSSRAAPRRSSSTGSTLTTTAGSITRARRRRLRHHRRCRRDRHRPGQGVRRHAVQATFGIAFAINEIRSTARASVDDSIRRRRRRRHRRRRLLARHRRPRRRRCAGRRVRWRQADSVITLAGAGAGAGNTIANTVAAIVTESEPRRRRRSPGLGSSTPRRSTSTPAASPSRSTPAAAGRFTSVAVGLSIALNTIANIVTASIDPTTSSPPACSLAGTTESVVVEAISTAVITALTIAGAAGSGAGAGAGSGNTISNQIEATVVRRLERSPPPATCGSRPTTAPRSRPTPAASPSPSTSRAASNPSSVNVAAVDRRRRRHQPHRKRRAGDRRPTPSIVASGADHGVRRLRADDPGLHAVRRRRRPDDVRRRRHASTLHFAGAGTGSGNKVDNIVEAVRHRRVRAHRRGDRRVGQRCRRRPVATRRSGPARSA